MENKDNYRNENQQGKPVTVAIHTYAKAQILRSILESEGIPAVIESINLIQPVVPSNVRVRINETDLARALEIIESVDFSSKLEPDPKPKTKEVLVPVDFSAYSLKACEFAFRLARDLDCDVKLLHAFFAPYYPASIPFGDSFTVQGPDPRVYKDIRDDVEKQMHALCEKIDAKIASGEIPRVGYSYLMTEGLPEEQVVEYSKKVNPEAIVMGTRGINAKELDLIGSVTAEVIEASKTPIFAIPENTKQMSLADMQRIVFLTNFQEREFKAFEVMMSFIKDRPVKVFLAHIAKKEDVWDEIKLVGIKKYLHEQHPSLEIDYRVIDRTEGLEQTLDKFVRENAIDLIAMSSSRRNIFARMFNPGIARRMLFHSDTPLLVIKGLDR